MSASTDWQCFCGWWNHVGRFRCRHCAKGQIDGVATDPGAATTKEGR